MNGTKESYIELLRESCLMVKATGDSTGMVRKMVMANSRNGMVQFTMASTRMVGAMATEFKNTVTDEYIVENSKTIAMKDMDI